MITFVLMAIGILVEALLPGSGVAAAHGKDGGNDKPDNAKESPRNKLKALALHFGEVRHESSRSISWHHWSDHELDPQQDERGSVLGMAKLMGISRRCWRVVLYVHSHEKVMLLPAWK